MAIFNVRKDGSGTHTTIQSAFIQAVSGDTIEVGPGVFDENVDFYKSGITLQGAGKDLTEIRGVLESNVTKSCTFTSGSTTLNIAEGTSGLMVGRFLSGLGLPTNARIVSISSTSVVISAATTSAKTNQSVVMTAIPSAIVVRGANHKVKDLKITAPQALQSRCLADNGAIFFRNTGNGEVPASSYILEDCIIEARGESAIMTDAAAGVGNGIIRNNTIQGQTFVGSSAAQVPAFGTMTKSGRVLSNRTIEFSELSGITAPHAGNTQGSEITPGLRVASISGNVVTVTANIPDAVGTTRSFSFGNVQFNFPNVARQLVVLQGNNAASQFLNNLVKGKTGSGISYNTAVTVDMANAVITGNTMNGEFKYGYALRARGAGATVSNNVNYSIPGNENAGYLIGPTGAQSFGYNIGTNTSIVKGLIGSSQAAGDSFVTFEMNKDLVKQNSKVSSDPVYSQESNWKLVNFVYKHTTSSRRLVSSFKSFGSSKKTKLKANMKSGDNFELHKIIISKSDKSFLVLKRSEISGASGFDFSLLNDGPEGSGGSGGGGGEPTNPNAITWYNVDSSKYTAGSNGSLQKLVNGNEVVVVENSFNGPFEVTYTFNGLLSSGSFLAMTDRQNVANGYGMYVKFDGSNNPIIGTTVGSNDYSFAAVGMASLSSGLNTLTFKTVASGSGLFFKIVLNGVESTGLTGVMPNTGWHTGVRLASSSDAIVSASKV